MDDYSQINFYLYLILLLSGLVLIIITFLLKNPWIQNRAEIKINRLGIDLSIDNRTLCVILGVILLLSTAYFLFQYDQDKLNDAELAQQKSESAKETFELAADHLKSLEETYDLEILFHFDGATDNLSQSEIQSFYKKLKLSVTYDEQKIELKQKDLDYAVGRFRLESTLLNLVLKVKGIKKDDKFTITAVHGDDKWEEDIIFPRLHYKILKDPKNDNHE